MDWLLCVVTMAAVVAMWVGRGWLLAAARLVAVVAVVCLIVSAFVLK